MRVSELLKNRFLTIGLSLLLVLFAVSVLEPLLVRLLIGNADPLATGNYGIFEPASAIHPLGTDRYGRDVLALLFVGTRYSLTIGVLAGLIGTLIGSVVGLIAGFYGGWVDNVLRSFTDMVLVIPTLPILITLAAYLRSPSIIVTAVLLAAFSWPFSARTIRAQVLSMRERGYVDLAKASGLSNIAIVFQEILPNLLPFLGVGLAASTVGAILAEFGLEVIGLGPGNISTLGLMINWAISWGSLSLGKWALIFAPAGVLVTVFVALNFVNIGLEQLFNPRLKGTTGL